MKLVPTKIICCLAALVMSLLAQEAEAQYAKIALREGPTPSAPLISPVPENAPWTLEIYHRLDILKAQRAVAKKANDSISSTEGERPPPPGSESDVVKIDNLYSAGVQWMESQTRSGVRFSQFIIGNLLVYENPRRNEVVVITPEESAEKGEAYKAGTFYGFEWINPENFRGVAVYREKECEVYQQGHRSGTGIARSAYIDRKTKLPVGLEDSNSITIYRFASRGKTLTLPEHYRKALADYKYENDRLKRRYSIPQ